MSAVRNLVPSPLRAAWRKERLQRRAQATENRGLRYGQEMVRSPESSASRPAANQLERYFDEHTTGPGIWKWRHYFDIYHRHFGKFVGRDVNVVEIGVFSGGSMGMWLDYFGSGCRVYGVDIQPECRTYESDSVEIFIGDQSDPAFWKSFVKNVPKIDIVIDDGGHEPHQQIATFECLFPHISPGGVFLCEDIHGINNGFHSYVSGVARNLNVKDGPTAFQSMVDSVHLYPFVTVIERPDVPLGELTSEKHGTQWQPLSFI